MTINKNISSQLYFDKFDTKKIIDKMILENTIYRKENSKIVIEDIKNKINLEEHNKLNEIISKYEKDTAKRQYNNNILYLDASIEDAKSLIIDILLYLNSINLSFKFINLDNVINGVDKKIKLKIGEIE